MPGKHVPQRTCVACRKTGAKRSLARVVRTPQGEVQLDPTGKRAGRGAYVHPQGECWERALQGALEGALKTRLTEEQREELREQARGLSGQAGAAQRERGP